MSEEQTHPVLEAVKDDLEIVPYTRKDRRLNYTIAIIVGLNFLAALTQLPWGSILG